MNRVLSTSISGGELRFGYDTRYFRPALAHADTALTKVQIRKRQREQFRRAQRGRSAGQNRSASQNKDAMKRGGEGAQKIPARLDLGLPDWAGVVGYFA
jgi:hypothetical protein